MIDGATQIADDENPPPGAPDEATQYIEVLLDADGDFVDNPGEAVEATISFYDADDRLIETVTATFGSP